MKKFSNLLILRKDKIGVDGKCPINIQVTLNSKVWKLPTGQKIELKFWDSKGRCCIGKGNGELNIYLNDLINKLNKFCLSRTTNHEPLNIDLIREYHNGTNLNCFYKVFEKSFEVICRNQKGDKSLSEATIYKYNLLHKNLKEFRSKIDISDIDIFFINKFEDFLISKGCGVHGTCSNHTKLNAIINQALKLKLMKENPYTNKEFKVESHKMNFLTIDELIKFTNVNVENDAGLQLTKDRFLFSCYTGITHIDINNLKKNNIDLKKGVIKFIRTKTTKEVMVPLNTKIRRLLIRYFIGKEDNDFLFPNVTNQNDNRRLKIFGEKINLKFGLCFHDGRHTFGSHMVNYLNIPITQVCKLMGHSDISITARYANTNISILKDAMRKMD